MPEDYVPRLSVEIPQDLYDKYVTKIPWGLRSRVMSILLEDVINLIDSHGDIVLAAIINRTITARHVITGMDSKIKKEEQDGAK